jgi:integrase
MIASTATASPSPGRRRLNTVREVCEEYLLRGQAGRSEPARQNARGNVAEFLTAHGDKLVADLIPDDLESWIEGHDAWVSDWTKMRVANVIKRVFAWAWQRGLIDAHPFKGVAFRPGERGKPIADADFAALLRDTSAEFRRVLLFLMWTGARPSEVSALKWADIDAENLVAVLQEHKTKHRRKDRAPRVICLPEKAVKLLTWILGRQWRGEEYVFVNSRGKPWNRRSLGLRVHRCRERCGIPKGATLYGCRRAFATKLSMAGVELKTLATLMGHTSTRMAEHYISMQERTEHLRASLEKGLADAKAKRI